eukprot:TRINITY_DN419_c0_g1_i1.p1 TRINITY_DN419_c0_g1~~TRINITY_DN419_c0_g1_i1.p1  ORF type:complete len:111 (-),score=22.10 TRINITY_DN419_c0_g1_i1:62-394(-)
MTPEDRIIVINAHPRIGLSPANLSTMSKNEQGAQDSMNTEEVLEQLNKLNDEYEEKFKFKFIVFVAGRPKSEIIPVIQERLNNSTTEEANKAVSEMMNIARDRLRKLSSS